jgi:excisionase family DNA binding protein
MTLLLTIPEVAEQLRVSKRTVERLISAGRIPVVRVASQRRFVRRTDLESYVERLG